MIQCLGHFCTFRTLADALTCSKNFTYYSAGRYQTDRKYGAGRYQTDRK